MTDVRYSVVGLGKLGACMAAAIAARGHDVIGVDVEPSVVAMLAEGRAPVQETELQETIELAGARLGVTSDVAAAVAETDVTFVVVPTPSLDDGSFSVEYAAAAMSDIGRGLAGKHGYHLVVLTSTVLPGDCRDRLLPVLEQSSGRRAGVDFGFAYSPEFIALGSVIRDFLNPDFLLVGELDERSGDLLERCYTEIVENGASCKRMSIENAELAKIALNSFVTMKIAFANTLAALCERVPGGDVDVVTDAIGADHRIGVAYLRGGLGFGGPCFPRDNRAFAHMSSELGVEPHLAQATDAANESVPGRVMARLEGRIGPGVEVAVLGLAYKPGTGVTDASQGVELARQMAEAGARVRAFDPLASCHVPGVRMTGSVDECIEGAEVVVIANSDPAFARVADALAELGRDVTVVDCWRALGAKELDGSPWYVPLGCDRSSGLAVAR